MQELTMEQAELVVGGDSSGYAVTAFNYGRGVAMVAGLAFGPVGAIAAGTAFTVGWGVGLLINKVSAT